MSHEDDTNNAESLTVDEFQCPVCLDVMFKPCVNSCGHAFCFWCFYGVMFGTCDALRRQEYSCPIGRSRFKRYPAICVPLCIFLLKEFPEEMIGRREQTEAMELEQNYAQSPRFDFESENSEKDEEVSTLGFVNEEFQCNACHCVACPPSVLSCGHVACHAGNHRSCPVANCDSSLPSEQVCFTLDSILRKTLSTKKYQIASGLSQKCRGGGGAIGSTASQNENSTDTTASNSRTHYGVGCDICRRIPIVGRRYKCADCKEGFGFDVCGKCFDEGKHTGPEAQGVFTQHHNTTHKLSVV